MVCTVCGAEVKKGRCTWAKYHPRIKAIQGYFSDGQDAFTKTNTFRNNAMSNLDYERLGFLYYIDFMKGRDWKPNITYPTYMGMILQSGVLPYLEKDSNEYNQLKQTYGLVYGFELGSGDLFDYGVARFFENSMFRAYFKKDTWFITKKDYINRDKEVTKRVPEKSLKKSSTEDYVLGYAKCLFDCSK